LDTTPFRYILPTVYLAVTAALRLPGFSFATTFYVALFGFVPTLLRTQRRATCYYFPVAFDAARLRYVAVVLFCLPRAFTILRCRYYRYTRRVPTVLPFAFALFRLRGVLLISALPDLPVVLFLLLRCCPRCYTLLFSALIYAVRLRLRPHAFSLLPLHPFLPARFAYCRRSTTCHLRVDTFAAHVDLTPIPPHYDLRIPRLHLPVYTTRTFTGRSVRWCI